MRIGALLRCTAVGLATAVAVLAGPGPATASGDLDQYLDLPLVNRHADISPGGVNPALPDDPARLGQLLDEARAQHLPPTRYAALLYQYWLVDTTAKAGIDLASWNPRDGVQANYQNLIKSYRYYEDLQLSHRELQWAGMGGEVGADFGGGLLDFDLATGIFALPGIADAAHAVVAAADAAAGPQFVNGLPAGLVALADAGKTITADDMNYVIGWILVMQKNIFSDLMPMHDAYVTGGLPALEEFEQAGLFGDDIMNAWRDIASGDQDRIADGNAVLLRREQLTIVGPQWDLVRAYKGQVGEAITYLSTLAGNPSVAGVVPPREYDSITDTFVDSGGQKLTATLPLPDWNWSVFDARWAYITDQLLPKYKDQVDNDWPQLEAVLRTPYEIQMQTHRPLLNVPQLLASAAQSIKVTPAAGDAALGVH